MRSDDQLFEDYATYTMPASPIKAKLRYCLYASIVFTSVILGLSLLPKEYLERFYLSRFLLFQLMVLKSTIVLFCIVNPLRRLIGAELFRLLKQRVDAGDIEMAELIALVDRKELFYCTPAVNDPWLKSFNRQKEARRVLALKYRDLIKRIKRNL